MGLNNNFTVDQIALIKQSIEDERKFMKDTILGVMDPPKLSPMKSLEQQQIENNTKAEQLMGILRQNIEEGVQFFMSENAENEKFRLGNIFEKIGSQLNEIVGEGEVNYLTTEDCNFLEEIARRKLINREYEAASCMFRLIVTLNFTFSGAWVGWAVSEQELDHLEAVEMIYQLAGETLPYDYYITLFAADFYAGFNQKDKAIAILTKSKEQLLADGMQSSKSFESIKQLLDELQI